MKNIDYIIKKVAEKNGLDEKLVDKVVKHHWKRDVRDEILTNKHPAIYLRYIGTIVFGRLKVGRAIQNLINKIRRITVSPKFTEEVKATIIERDKVMIRRLLVHRNRLAIKRLKYLDVREAKRIRQAAATSIEQSDGDSSWVDE